MDYKGPVNYNLPNKDNREQYAVSKIKKKHSSNSYFHAVIFFSAFPFETSIIFIFIENHIGFPRELPH